MTLTLALTLWTTSTCFVLVLLFPPTTIHSSAIANKESLSSLETEMRKLEGIVKEISEEMAYLKRREEKFTDTNGAFSSAHPFIF